MDSMLSAVRVRAIFCPVANFATFEANLIKRFFDALHLLRGKMRVLTGIKCPNVAKKTIKTCRVSYPADV